jgi:hypothetical protein
LWKAAGIFLVLMTGFLHNAHLGIRRSMERTGHKIEVWLDKTPPTAPQSLVGGPAPKIQRVASYYSRAHIVKHVMAPFDSSGGDLLVAFVSSHALVTLTPSDNFNNTWISLAGPTNSNAGLSLRSQIWYAKNPKVGPDHVFTITLSTGQSLTISMFVVKGSNIWEPIDAVSTIGDDAGRQTLNPTSPRISTTSPNDLLIGFGKSALGEVWSAGGAFTFRPDASSNFMVAESGLALAPASYNSRFVLGGPSNWQAAVVAVKPAQHRPTPQITLAWQPSGDNVGVAGYQVERCDGVDCKKFVQIGISKDNSFVDSTLVPAVYRYRVRAMDEALNASGYSNAIIVNAGSSRD